MILNATLTRIDSPGRADEAGVVPYTSGSAIAVRCCLDVPNYRQQRSAQQLAVDASAVLYALCSTLPAGANLPVRCRVSVTPDQGEAQIYLAAASAVRSHGDQSHYELLLVTE